MHNIAAEADLRYAKRKDLRQHLKTAIRNAVEEGRPVIIDPLPGEAQVGFVYIPSYLTRCKRFFSRMIGR